MSYLLHTKCTLILRYGSNGTDKFKLSRERHEDFQTSELARTAIVQDTFELGHWHSVTTKGSLLGRRRCKLSVQIC